MREASIGVASAPLASTSVRRRERVSFMGGETPFFRGFLATVATSIAAKLISVRGSVMPDRDDLGSAWKVPPSRYLASRPAEHQVGAPRSGYVTMPYGSRPAVDTSLPYSHYAHRCP